MKASKRRTPLYDDIGAGYDTTRRADPYLLARLIRHLAPREGVRVLDVACGTGNYTAALAARGFDISGIDASRRMIAAARAKMPADRAVALSVASAEALPYRDGCFAAALTTLAIHHFADLEAAFAEVARVLDPVGGRYVLFTSTPEQMERYWLGDYFPDMMARAAAQMPSLKAVRSALAAAGFSQVATEPYSVRPDHSDMFLYAAKTRPQLYLDARIRAGISSFADLADETEVEAGLARLAADIASGAIDTRIGAAQNPRGDYLFVMARQGEAEQRRS